MVWATDVGPGRGVARPARKTVEVILGAMCHYQTSDIVEWSCTCIDL